MQNEDNKNRKVISLTKDNKLVVVENGQINYYDSITDQLIKSIDSMDTNRLVNCVNGFIVFSSGSEENHDLELFDVEKGVQAGNITVDTTFEEIIAISTDGKTAAVKTMKKIFVLNVAENDILYSIDSDQVRASSLSEDGRYYAYLNTNNSIVVYDIDKDDTFSIDFDLKIPYESWSISIRFYTYEGHHRLVMSGTFVLGEKKGNLCIFDIDKRQILYHANVSPSGRTPKVEDGIVITDHYIILCAVYGGMNQNYLIWLANLKDGSYIKDIFPEGSGSVKKIVDSRSMDMIVVRCGGVYYRENPIQILNLGNNDQVKVMSEVFN